MIKQVWVREGEGGLWTSKSRGYGDTHRGRVRKSIKKG